MARTCTHRTSWSSTSSTSRTASRTSLGSPSYLSHTVGTGKFTLYRDGKALSGTWRRPTTSAPTAFLDAHGKPVAFKPGKTWVVLAPQTSSFSAS